MKNLFGGFSSKKNKNNVCQADCTVGSEMKDDQCKSASPQVPDYLAEGTTANGKYLNTKEFPAQCVPISTAGNDDTHLTPGVCQNCKAPDNACFVNSDCASGKCVGTGLGLTRKDGKCTDMGRLPGQMCKYNEECNDASLPDEQCVAKNGSPTPSCELHTEKINCEMHTFVTVFSTGTNCKWEKNQKKYCLGSLSKCVPTGDDNRKQQASSSEQYMYCSTCVTKTHCNLFCIPFFSFSYFY